MRWAQIEQQVRKQIDEKIGKGSNPTVHSLEIENCDNDVYVEKFAEDECGVIIRIWGRVE